MPWIRFWHQGRCPSGHNDEESRYEWFERRLDDNQLRDHADELVPSWRREAERGYKYGFEVVRGRLPARIRDRLVVNYERAKANAERMLDNLNSKKAVPKPKKLRSRKKSPTAWDLVGSSKSEV